MPQIDPTSMPPKDLQGLGLHVFKWDREATFAQIREMKLGQTIYVGYTAAYAGFLEFRGSPSSLFAAMVAQRWPAIVDQTAAEVRRKLRL